MIENFERMIREGKDSALLRFGLGQEYLRQGAHEAAAEHFNAAVTLDPAYSAAWKLLGKAREAGGDDAGARAAWSAGLSAAQARGDKQAVREMQVFLKRLEKRVGDSDQTSGG
ncbi:MAG: tetratricopeptide repeat protein [Betaproteobacteria bacterium]|nr:tetratricopeptide repeat protein [Betaproteobacteria bacterium]